jgi:hypothetical protein
MARLHIHNSLLLVLLGELVDRVDDDFVAAIRTHCFGRVVGVTSGTIPIALHIEQSHQIACTVGDNNRVNLPRLAWAKSRQRRQNIPRRGATESVPSKDHRPFGCLRKVRPGTPIGLASPRHSCLFDESDIRMFIATHGNSKKKAYQRS